MPYVNTRGRSQNACLAVISKDYGQHSMLESFPSTYSNAIHQNDGYLKVMVVGAYPSAVQCPDDPATDRRHGPPTNGSFRLEETVSNECTP